MIYVDNLTKEFTIRKRKSGFMESLKGLFSNETYTKKAVDNISFHIAKGEVVGYIGANGAGKSTSIKMMAGILTPTSGSCTVNGIIPYENRMKNASQIGVVFGQRTQLWWDLPLCETFLILKKIYSVEDKDYNKRIKTLSEVLRLNDFINDPVRTLSLGQRMSADLAAALIHNPKILFLDEPTIGLDIIVKEKMVQAIKELNEEFCTTILLTTHDLNNIEQLCKRIIVIDNGKIIHDGGIKEIKQQFGFMRIIDAEIISGNNTLPNDQEISKIFNVSNKDINISIENDNMAVTFNNNKLDISEVISFLTSKVKIIDLHIHDIPIEEIIKKIYQGGYKSV